MAAYNIHLRKRLREYAVKHKNRVLVDDFIQEQLDLSELSLAEPVTLAHTRQILARSPEFIRMWTGKYKYNPEVAAEVEAKRKAYHASRIGKKRARVVSDDDFLKDIFG